MAICVTVLLNYKYTYIATGFLQLRPGGDEFLFIFTADKL